MRGAAHVAIALAVAVVAACGDREAVAPTSTAPAAAAEPPALHDRELTALWDYEKQRRHDLDFAAAPPADDVLGPDPYRIAPLRDGERVGILRGESAVVVVDAEGRERTRLPAPRSASGLAVTAAGDVLVVGDGAREIAQYRDHAGQLERVATLPVDALGLRDIAVSPAGNVAYVVEERAGRLLALDLAREPGRALRIAGVRELGRCHGPIRVAAVGDVVATDCLLDHTLELRRGGAVTRIHHDGPIWSFAMLREPDGGLVVAAGGIEDHPLVRDDGGFGNIDSFVYLYRVAAGGAATRLAAINVSELGAVTPKWLALSRGEQGGLVVTTAGYGGSTLITLAWGADLAAAPVVARAELPPGTADADLAGGTGIVANPLLDAWVVVRDGRWRAVPVASARPTRSTSSRIGEALLFTTMMAPWQSSTGALSRFTCEACHFEGYVDGRIHFTGRRNGTDDVYATTRPLYGLFNNRPHFSRALDKTTTQMVHNEFKVANRHSGHDPWFALARADLPWLAELGAPEQLAPEFLREAVLAFLADFSHRANPSAQDHARFTDLERAGARVFRDRCASCHAPRLVSDDAASTVAFERWEPLVLSPGGPLVWSDGSYAKTGVLPYVHDDGARVPSLRRLYKKWPYFTNGSAKSLAEVVTRYASSPARGRDRAYHAGAPADGTAVPLSGDDQAAVLAFLDLL